MLKKSLSQNLIKDKKILRKMVALANVTEDDVVVEIGAGHGDFTRAICERAGAVFAIELDQSFKYYLEPLEEEQKNLRVIFSDILDTPLAQFAGDKKIKIMGNIPYGITGPILFKIMEERSVVHSAYLTTQKEIGQRVTSISHRRSYGAVSVNCQLVADVKVLYSLKAGVFIPPPKVDSVYFSMVFKEDALSIDSALMGFVRHCFENKRKYLKNALSKYYGEEQITTLYDAMNFAPSIRAEEIEPQTFVEMYTFLKRTVHS
ncbi:MAG: ribosomal RNA small subunit methyltransferase A [Syntrophus sp. (in: bacteria)]|nr:ribosomal RNA small subunit methyltransferase A [Syntrophus sp. (in: bacteria)]